MRLDRDRAFAHVYGHETAVYEQGGVLFDGAGNPVKPMAAVRSTGDSVIPHNRVDSSRVFLLNILKSGPLSKSAVYKVSSDNNQAWEDVKAAADLIGVVKFQYQKSETWKLPEEIKET